MQFKILMIGFVLVLGLVSCKTTKDTKDTGPSLSNEEELFMQIKENLVVLNYFNSTAKLDIDSEFFSGSANAKIRLAKDSVLWISVSKLGIELARVLITPDSVIGLERIQKTYFKLAKDEITNMMGYFVDFQMMQDFILGNPYLDQNQNSVKFVSLDTLEINPYRKDAKIRHLFSNPNLELVSSRIFVEPQIQIDLSYEEYNLIPETDKKFSYFRNIEVQSEDEYPVAVSFDFNKPEIDIEKSYKLSIPDSYTPREF